MFCISPTAASSLTPILSPDTSHGVSGRLQARESAEVERLVLSEDGLMQGKLVSICSQVAEIGVFLGAAAALAAGMLGLR
jgi:hypothetical protein